jgi:hypothetical protein
MRNKAALFAGLICAFGVHEAQACHRFARWYYPWPQQCGTHWKPGNRGIGKLVNREAPNFPDFPTPPLKVVEIPLPEVGFTACPDASDEARGRILLRAALDGETH